MRMTKDKARGAYGTAQRLRVVNHGVSPSVQHLVCLTYPLCHNCIFSVNSVSSVLKKSTAKHGKFSKISETDFPILVKRIFQN